MTKPNIKISHGTVANDLLVKKDDIDRSIIECIRKELGVGMIWRID